MLKMNVTPSSHAIKKPPTGVGIGTSNHDQTKWGCLTSNLKKDIGFSLTRHLMRTSSPFALSSHTEVQRLCLHLTARPLQLIEALRNLSPPPKKKPKQINDSLNYQCHWHYHERIKEKLSSSVQMTITGKWLSNKSWNNGLTTPLQRDNPSLSGTKRLFNWKKSSEYRNFKEKRVTGRETAKKKRCKWVKAKSESHLLKSPWCNIEGVAICQLALPPSRSVSVFTPPPPPHPPTSP